MITCGNQQQLLLAQGGTVDPRLPGYDRTRPWPDKWTSWICESSCK